MQIGLREKKIIAMIILIKIDDLLYKLIMIYLALVILYMHFNDFIYLIIYLSMQMLVCKIAGIVLKMH